MWKYAHVFICLLLCSCAQLQAQNTQNIRFSEIEKFVDGISPRSRQIESEYQLMESERRKALEWSNPVLGVESQSVDGNRESEFTLSKQFEFPWSYLTARKAWDFRIRAAQQQRLAGLRELKAELKTGYVTLGLYEEQLERLEHLRTFVLKASEIAKQRHQEGFISGIDNHLVQMVLLNLSASRQQANDERRQTFVDWCATMGLSTYEDVELDDRPGFHTMPLKPLSEYVAELEEQPVLRSQLLTADAWSRFAAAENQRTLPGIDLAAGVKRIGSESGTVLGFSMTLPLLNTNRATVNTMRAHEQISRSQIAVIKSRTELTVKSLVESISELESMLEPAASGFAAKTQVMADILLSYEEGFTSLSELLNSFQIEIAGSASYYEQLRKYYANLFELEAITGDEIVKFGD